MLRKMSALQFEEWKAYFRVKAWEQEEESKKAKQKGR
jgi:hypothetical protein